MNRTTLCRQIDEQKIILNESKTYITKYGSIHKDIIVMNQGPYSWKILVLRVASSNNILRKFLEMWVFPLKIKDKILVKKK